MPRGRAGFAACVLGSPAGPRPRATAMTDPKREGIQDESALVSALRSGDETAFERLVRLLGGRLYATARRFLRNDEDARDVVQETFIAVFRSVGGFAGGSSLSTWVHRILINGCLMRLRSASRRPELPIEGLLPRFDDTGHRVAPEAAWPVSAERALIRNEEREKVRASIARLPESYRLVLVLRDIEELSTEEVSKALGLTPNAVKIRLHRARQALRTLVAPMMAAAGPAK